MIIQNQEADGIDNDQYKATVVVPIKYDQLNPT